MLGRRALALHTRGSLPGDPSPRYTQTRLPLTFLRSLSVVILFLNSAA